MAFLGPNDFLVLEQHNGNVQRVIDGKILDKPLLNVNVSNGFYQGMLGIAVAKHTGGQHMYSILYTGHRKEWRSSTGNKLYRYELVNNKLINPKLLLNLPGDQTQKIMVEQLQLVQIIMSMLLSEMYIPINPKEPPVQTLTENYRNSTVVDGRSGILRITQDGKPVGKGYLVTRFH